MDLKQHWINFCSHSWHFMWVTNPHYPSITIPFMSHYLSSSLVRIRHLSFNNNQITELPIEFCALLTLEEVYAAGNKLVSLPLEIGYLTNLEKLYLQRNRIRELPEVIFGVCLFLCGGVGGGNWNDIFDYEVTWWKKWDVRMYFTPTVAFIFMDNQYVLEIHSVSIGYE